MTNLTTQPELRIDNQLQTRAEPVLNALSIKTVDALEICLTQMYLANAFSIELKKAANNTEN